MYLICICHHQRSTDSIMVTRGFSNYQRILDMGRDKKNSINNLRFVNVKYKPYCSSCIATMENSNRILMHLPQCYYSYLNSSTLSLYINFQHTERYMYTKMRELWHLHSSYPTFLPLFTEKYIHFLCLESKRRCFHVNKVLYQLHKKSLIISS